MEPMDRFTALFKVSYLDAGLSTTYFDTGDTATSGASGPGPKLNHR